MITCEKLHPGKAGTLFCLAAILFCWDEIFPCDSFNLPKQDKKVNEHISLKKFIEVHLKRFTRERLASQLAKVSSKIFLLYFYDECDVNLWEKKLTNEISSFYESMGFRELTCLQRKIKRKFIQMYTNAWWKTVPPCRDEV